MPPEMLLLHTGRAVPRPYFVLATEVLGQILNGKSLEEIFGAHELARLAGDYSARGRSAGLTEAETRQWLTFGFEAAARAGILDEGRFLSSVAMEILVATLANPTETSYDVLNPLTGELIGHRDLI